MRKNSLPKALLLVAMVSAAGLGCELIVDFDRTKIPSDGADANTSVPDTSTDATTVIDTGTDATTDAGEDAASDAAADAPADAPEDG